MSVPESDFHRNTAGARKVMVVDLGFLGDSIHLIPALWEIRRHHANAAVHVLTSPVGCEVLRLVPCVDRVWPLELHPERRTLRQQWTMLRALRRERFDVAYNFSGADRSVIWTGLLGVPWSVGHAAGRPHFWSPWLIRHWVPRRSARLPVYEQRRQVLQECGFQLDPPRWDLRLPDDARRHAADWLPPGSVHLSICASHALKEWPLDHWVRLAGRLLGARPGLRLVATVGRDAREQEQLHQLAARVAHAGLLTRARPELAELAAILGRCRLHVGSDSGVLHLAVAMGLPTVALFRDYADADAWAPAGAAHRVFRLPCECVNRRDGPCTADGQARCLARLEPACVEQAILELLDGDKPLASAPGALL